MARLEPALSRFPFSTGMALLSTSFGASVSRRAGRPESQRAALLADTIHDVSDALAAVPLWIAFTLGRRSPTRR
ncbi:hypothetical protein [Pseudonocardia charpentierae]|uniref:Cation efflux family protein n=1 Tax=Pseudonocardia charpentierae TaxID=3075545 RepID=A0ABU2NIW5_9PSEU|nr:hypothetical protein [Pseudonocardia sp. DSM 45834]MDT0353839.1 hypothetical protein [Pseudonocardia sp. DSM 45834]